MKYDERQTSGKCPLKVEPPQAAGNTFGRSNFVQDENGTFPATSECRRPRARIAKLDATLAVEKSSTRMGGEVDEEAVRTTEAHGAWIDVNVQDSVEKKKKTQCKGVIGAPKFSDGGSGSSATSKEKRKGGKVERSRVRDRTIRTRRRTWKQTCGTLRGTRLARGAVKTCEVQICTRGQSQETTGDGGQILEKVLWCRSQEVKRTRRPALERARTKGGLASDPRGWLASSKATATGRAHCWCWLSLAQ